MTTIDERRKTFRALHQSGCFVLPNPWDAGGAMRLAKLGFLALASTSAGAAWALGKADGAMTLEEVLQRRARGHRPFRRERCAGRPLRILPGRSSGFASHHCATAGLQRGWRRLPVRARHQGSPLHRATGPLGGQARQRSAIRYRTVRRRTGERWRTAHQRRRRIGPHQLGRLRQSSQQVAHRRPAVRSGCWKMGSPRGLPSMKRSGRPVMTGSQYRANGSLSALLPPLHQNYSKRNPCSFCGPRQAGHPHFESPQFRQVMQPSIMTTAAVLHLLHSCAPSGKCEVAKASF